VAKAFLEYKGHANRRLPTSVVIKQVNGKNGISTFQKLGLFLKPYFPSISFGATIEELAYRLQGYLIELQFYRTHAREVRVPIPECYFSYYDYFNVRFVMIMEDLSPCENGEPDGFTPDQAKALLTNLASLHAQFWHSSGFKSEKKLWSYGGYWLGNKEMSHNKTIPSVFESTLSNFPVILEEFPEARRFSTALTKNLNLLTQAVHAREPKTLIHGDYKISNIFVDLKSSPYKPYSIDWQWMGRGNCATDVAYLLYTSLALTNPKWSFDTDKHAVSKDPKYSHYSAHEMDLLRTYYNALISHDNVTDYTFEEFEQQYAVNQVYFTVFCLREKWSTMSSTNMDFFYTNKIDGLHLRTKDHMIQMLKRSAVLLQHIDFEATKKLGYRSWKNKL
jgi:thiamine kinase-like enzyme